MMPSWRGLRASRQDHGYSPPRRAWRVPAALAASVIAAAFGLHWYSVQQREAQAREQLLLALQITSYELNQVQRRLVRPATQEDGT